MVTICLPGDGPSCHFLDSLGSYRTSPSAGEPLRTCREQLQAKRQNTWGQLWSSEMQKVLGKEHG